MWRALKKVLGQRPNFQKPGHSRQHSEKTPREKQLTERAAQIFGTEQGVRAPALGLHSRFKFQLYRTHAVTASKLFGFSGPQGFSLVST